MDDLIDIFIESRFTPELQQEINRSFGLIEFFEYKQAYSGFIDILSNQSSYSTDDMHDMFIKELNDKLDHMLSEHALKLNPHATIFQKNEILLALAHIQNLEDYTSIISVLESLEDDDLRLSVILSDLCTLDEPTLLDLIAQVDPKMLQILKDFIYNREESKVQSDVSNEKLLSNFRAFTQIYGQGSLAAQMVIGGMTPAQDFNTYLNYIESEIVTSEDEQTALNIMSLIYLSEDGFNSPLLVYRKYSYRLLQDINRVSKIETLILGMIAKLTEHKKAQDEQARLFASSP